MKIVTILGSPHGARGSTATLLQETARTAAESGAEVVSLSLAEQPVGPCVACDACHRLGTCPMKDAFPAYQKALEEADGVVLASPNYLFSVSAQMKALMDRCCGLLHVQRLRGKYGAAVVTSGGPESPEGERYLVRFLRAMGCRTTGSAGASVAELMAEETRAARLKAAGDLGRQLVAAIREQAPFPEQTAERAAFGARMRQVIALHAKAWRYETDYWQAHGEA